MNQQQQPTQLPEQFALPRLRNDLIFTPVLEKKSAHYIIEDPLSHTFYRVGKGEYLFISQINNHKTLDALLVQLEESYAVHLDIEQGMTIVNWLNSRQLLRGQTTTLKKALDQQEKIKTIKKINRLNLISFKIPLWNPDSFFRRTSPLFFLVSKGFLFLWLILGISACWQLGSHFKEFTQQVPGILGSENLPILWLIWFGLKILHEGAHTLVCYRFGGRVYETGLLFIVFIPLSYVNATSSWQFPRRERMAVGAAGIIAELTVAFIAIFVWVASPESTSGFIAHNTVIVAGISSLLFNANPLMRFDGYYLLSDFLNMPNIYQKGVNAIKVHFARFFLGIPNKTENHAPSPMPSCWIQLYGGAVHIWRILVLFGLGLAASNLAGGVGVFITAVAILFWVGMPLVGFFGRWPHYREKNPQVLFHFSLRIGLCLVTSCILLYGVRWEKRVETQAVVKYHKQYRIKALTEGFIEKILTKDGANVERNAPLLQLTNPELNRKKRDIELQLAQLDIRLRNLQSSQNMIELSIIREEQHNLNKQLLNLKKDIEHLTIFAPVKGKVFSRNLHKYQGMYIQKGVELLWLIDSSQLELAGLASQEDIASFRAQLGEKLTVDMRPTGGKVFTGTLVEISPTVTTRLTHPALGAVFGGALDVRQKIATKNRNETESNAQYTLFQPHFSLRVSLPDTVQKDILAGQRATLSLRGKQTRLISYLNQKIKKWFNKKVNISKQNAKL